MDLISKPPKDDYGPLTLDTLEAIVARLALADPTRIAAVRKAACRYCYGKLNLYQWRSVREYRERRAFVSKCNELALMGRPVKPEDMVWPSKTGGFGYTRLLPPHDGCPECDGFGVDFVQLEDHTKLRPHEKALLNGIDVDRHGRITVKIERKSTYMKALTDLLKLRMIGAEPEARNRIHEILQIAVADDLDAIK